MAKILLTNIFFHNRLPDNIFETSRDLLTSTDAYTRLCKIDQICKNTKAKWQNMAKEERGDRKDCIYTLTVAIAQHLFLVSVP